MSQAGVFNLLNEDARFDAPLFAFDALLARLRALYSRRVKEAVAAGTPLRVAEDESKPTERDLRGSHRLFVRAQFRPCVPVASEFVKVVAQGDIRKLNSGSQTIKFTFPAYGNFTSDMVLHFRLGAVGNPLLAASDATAANPLYRYCAYPGLRLIEQVVLKSDSTVLDTYNTDDAVMYMKYCVPVDRRPGWDRCLGQQEAQQAQFYANGHTEYTQYADGPQTPKPYQPELNLMIPLQFWFCRSPDQSLYNDMLPNTQRTLEFTIAPLDRILQACYPDPAEFGALIPADIPATLACEPVLYVDNLWVSPEVYDIFARRIKLDLIRLHRQQISRIKDREESLLINQLRFPTEYVFAGARTLSNALDMDWWPLMGAPAVRTDPATRLYVPAYIWNAAVGMPQLVAREAKEVSTLQRFITRIGFQIETIPVYQLMPATFFNAYMPLRYENNLMVTPQDSSTFFLNFSLFPRDKECSGYQNLSSARNIRLDYTLDPAFDPVTRPAEWVLCGTCINFLVTRGDHISLRYAV